MTSIDLSLQAAGFGLGIRFLVGTLSIVSLQDAGFGGYVLYARMSRTHEHTGLGTRKAS